MNPSGFAHLDSMALKSPTRRHAANAVTAVRVLLLPVMLGSIATHQRILAVLVFLVVAASDYFDGRIARHYGAESRAGRVFDHVADIAFILATLGLYVMLGVVPWWVPVSIGLSFAVYVSDSVLRSRGRGGAQLVGSRVGHLGGVLNYTLIGILVFDQTAGLQWIPPALMAVFFFLVPIYSGAAILTRFLPASPDP